MRLSIGKGNKAIDAGMKLLHLFHGSSTLLGAFDKAIHVDDKLSRRQDGLLRFDV